MGYNRNLTDFDLKVSSGARMATIVIKKETLLGQLKYQRSSQRNLERWESTNQLELLPELQQTLKCQLRRRIERGE